MNAIFKKVLQLPSNQLILFLSLTGILIAAQINYIQHGWINNDSVIYFEAARLFAEGRWLEGYTVFAWPLYSALIALIHKLTTLNIHLSAQILNVILFGTATASFLKLIQLAGGENKVILAGGLILFSSQYVVGDVLQMLLRDQGFWAFFLASLVFFVRFYKSSKLTDALLWQVCIILAMLFRIEAITYLFLLPFILLSKNNCPLKERIQAFLKSHILNIIGACVVGFLLLTSNDFSIDNMGRLREVFTLDLYSELTKELFTRSDLMATQVLGPFLDEFATEGLLLTFVFVMAAKILSTTGWISTGFALLTIRFHQKFIDPESWQVIKAAMLIAVLNMFLIVTKVFVLSGRYVVALALLLMILASFYLAHALKYVRSENNHDKSWKWLLIALIVIMLLGAIKNILPKREGYNYQQEAVTWLQEHNPDNLPVFSNDSRIKYYAGLPFTDTWQDNWKILTREIKKGSINNYAFLLISDIEDPERERYLAEHLPDFKEVMRSSNSKGKKHVVVYQKQSR